MARVEDAPRTDGELLSAGIATVRSYLPPAWSLSVDGAEQYDDAGVDAVVTLSGADGRGVTLFVVVKRLPAARDFAGMRTRLAALTAGRSASVGVVVSQYLSRTLREQFAGAGLSYVDATGNVLIQSESPALFISGHGAESDPWRGPGRPKGGLGGESAANVVRALLDFSGPWKIRDLIGASGASTGSVYRVAEFLESEGLVARERRGPIRLLDWQALLRLWSRDYEFLETNSVTRWIAPRGLPALFGRMRDSGVDRYALTGSAAAAAWAEYAPTRSAMVYARDPESVAAAWGLRPATTGVNVLIAQPAYPVVFERTVEALDGLTVAAPTQVAVDLMTGPGRAPAEAEELLDWMGDNEQSWRRPT